MKAGAEREVKLRPGPGLRRVELDGGQHFVPSVESYDRRRTAYLNGAGITVLRFTSDLVFRELRAVLEVIAGVLAGGPSP